MYSKYMISNKGRIRNKFGYYLNTHPISGGGYIRVTMIDDLKRKRNVRVHRIVCSAFTSNLENKRTVNHKDHNKWNNHASNLEWATTSEQNNHKRKSILKFSNIESSPLDIWVNIPQSFIRNELGYCISPSGKIKNRKGRVSVGRNKDGYLWVIIASKSYQLHVLMAKVFLPNIGKKPYVNHKDGNKENAKISNLEWCTPSENVQHAIQNKLASYCKGIKVCNIIDHSITTFNSIRELERTLKISHKTVKKYVDLQIVYKHKFIFKM